MAEPPDDMVTIDRLLGGRVLLRQPASGHRAGTDAVLLAGLAEPREGDHVLDLGSGTGAVGLMLAARVPGIRLTLAEIDPGLVALATRNIHDNGFGGRADVVLADALAPTSRNAPSALPVGTVDLVVTNPPFHPATGRHSPDPARRTAHVLDDAGLRAWIATAARALKPRGRLALIYRADRLDACLAALHGFGSLRIRFVHPLTVRPAIRVVIQARRGGRAPIVVEPPMILHARDGGFTVEAAALHGQPAA